MDLLKEAAEAWVKLSESAYSITYGKSKRLYNVEIVFDSADFYHLSGFQYLDDLKRAAFPRSGLITAILNRQIQEAYIRKSRKYLEFVESRLIALKNLEAALDSNFQLFKYNPRAYPFHTKIQKADYLIEGKTPDNSLFFFAVNEKGTYHGMSIFMKADNKNFSSGQKSLSILKKEKINVRSSSRTILIDTLYEKKA